MGMQGLLRTSAVFGRPAADQGGFVRLALLVTSVAIVPFLAGCSSSSPFSAQANSPPPNQTAGVPPPPNYAVTAAGQPAYAPPPGQPAYTPPQGQPGYPPPPGQPAYAPPPAQPGYAQQPAPHATAAPPPAAEQGTSAGSFRQSYVGFLQMFRDPPEPDPSAPPSYDARASVYPQQSLADSFKGSTD